MSVFWVCSTLDLMCALTVLSVVHTPLYTLGLYFGTPYVNLSVTRLFCHTDPH